MLEKIGQKKAAYEPLLENLGDVFAGREKELTKIGEFINTTIGENKGGLIVCHSPGGWAKRC